MNEARGKGAMVEFREERLFLPRCLDRRKKGKSSSARRGKGWFLDPSEPREQGGEEREKERRGIGGEPRLDL